MFRSKKNGFLIEEIPTIIINSPSDEIKMSETSLNGRNDEEEEENGECSRLMSLRRNSISLPNLDDMMIINSQVEVSKLFFLYDIYGMDFWNRNRHVD